MFRLVTKRLCSVISQASSRQLVSTTARTQIAPLSTATRKYSSAVTTLSDEQKDAAWVEYFDNPELDYFDFCLGFRDLWQEDAIPEPIIVQSALYACRRLNNLPLAIRCLELVRIKCQDKKEIYDYVIQELGPTFEDLGIKTPEQLGLDQVED